MKKISSTPILSYAISLGVSWRHVASLLLFLSISAQVNAQVKRAGNDFSPAQGVSKIAVEPDGSGVVTVVPVSPTVIPLGLNRYIGPTANNANTKQMSANRIVLPPGARGPRNLHVGADSILMIIQGNLTSLIGAGGEKKMTLKAGDFLYVPGDVWHQRVNTSKTKSVTFVEIRADADDYTNAQIIPTP